MTQSFVPTPDTDKHPANVDVITDAVEHGGEIIYQNGTDHASVTHSPLDTETVFSERPGSFMTRHVPRKPLVGRCNPFTVNVFGDNVPRLFLGSNINRCRVQLFTDVNNTAPILIGTGSGTTVGLAPGGLPIELKTFMELYVQSIANGTLYVIEEDYYGDQK